MIYLSDQFSYRIKNVIVRSDLWDGQFIDVHGENLRGKLTIGNIYRPPRFNNNNSTFKQFLSELDPVLSSITKDNTNVIITGYFNIDLLQINDRVEIQKYFDLFVTRGLFPKITLPTRSAIYNALLIDQLYCKVTDPRQHIVSYLIKSNMSDHYPYFSILDILKHVKHKPKYVKISNMNENSFSFFVVKLPTDLWTPVELFNDPNENYNKFERTLLDAKSKFLAPKTVRYKKYKLKISPWITSRILHSIEYRDKLYRELKNINPETENVLYFSVQQNLRVYNGMLKKTIRKAKVEYYSNQFNKSKSNIRHMWSVVKEILNRSHDKKEFPNYFTVDGGRITDSQDISNCFNDFFSSVSPKLSSNIVCNSDRSVSSFFKTMCCFIV